MDQTKTARWVWGRAVLADLEVNGELELWGNAQKTWGNWGFITL